MLHNFIKFMTFHFIFLMVTTALLRWPRFDHFSHFRKNLLWSPCFLWLKDSLVGLHKVKKLHLFKSFPPSPCFFFVLTFLLLSMLSKLLSPNIKAHTLNLFLNYLFVDLKIRHLWPLILLFFSQATYHNEYMKKIVLKLFNACSWKIKIEK